MAKKSIAVTHNNPGNLKYADWMAEYGATPGQEATDGGKFARFPDTKTGLAARQQLLKRSYGNDDIESGLRRYSNQGYGSEIYPEIAGKKFKDLSETELNELTKRQVRAEDATMFKTLYPNDKTVYPNAKRGNSGTQSTPGIGILAQPKLTVPETKLYTSGEFTGQRKYTPMTRMSGADFNQKPSITAKPLDKEDPRVANMIDPYKKETKPRVDMGNTASSVTPYLSNIYNAFQKPAPVPQPVYNKPISLQRIDMNNDRYEANKDYRADILNADRTLDGNTSVGVKQLAKAQKFNNMSKINQQERNENLAISNKEIGINAGIQQGNNEMLYNYRTLGAERQNAIRTQQSANFANAADKFVAQQGVKNQYALEDRKLDILENTDEYGTNKRLMKKLMQPEEKKMGGSLGKYSAGSFMKKLKTVY